MYVGTDGTTGGALFKACVCYLNTDRRDASWIYKGLDNYFLDKASIVTGNKQVYARAEPIGWISRLALKDDQPGNLSETQKSILDCSEVLIVVCSPRGAKSQKLDAAVRHFQSGPAPKILAVVSDGTEDGGAGKEDLGWLAPAMKFEVNQDGSLSDRPQEILAVDLRVQPRARALAKIVSGVMDVPFDAIWNRAARKEVRRAWWVLPLAPLAALPLLGIIVIVAGGPPIRDWSARQSQALLSKSEVALKMDDTTRAARLALLATYSARLHFFGWDPRAAEELLRATLAVDAQNQSFTGDVQDSLDFSSWEALKGKELIRHACESELADGRGYMSDQEVAMISYSPSGPYRDLCKLPLWLLSE